MRAIDVSRHQGVIDWPSVKAPIVIIKMSGGDDGLYYDSKASKNYSGAKAAGKAVGMYHFAGGGDPVQEADYFIRACSPLEKDDVLVLDWEVQHANPVGWCAAFIDHVIAKTGVRPLIYMNSYTASSINWQPIVDRNIGLWVAHYGLGPKDNVPVGKWPTYVMHQYTSTGRESGVGGGNANVDVNEWFGTIEQFKKYGWQPASPAPAPTPAPKPTPPPAPVPDPTPVPTPPVIIEPAPQPIPEPKPEPIPVVDPPAPIPTPDNNPVRPKVKAGAIAGIVLTAVVGLLGLFGINLGPENTEGLLTALTGITTVIIFVVSYFKKDGLSPN